MLVVSAFLVVGLSHSSCSQEKEEKSKKEVKNTITKKESKRETKNGVKKEPSKKEPSTYFWDEVAGKTKDGKTVYAGPRRGFYTMSSSGNKNYVKENEIIGAKVIGKTAGGKTIYEGPRGGRYYYNSSNVKTYVKKQ